MLDVADKPVRYGGRSNAGRQKQSSGAGSPFSGTFRAEMGNGFILLRLDIPETAGHWSKHWRCTMI